MCGIALTSHISQTVRKSIVRCVYNCSIVLFILRLFLIHILFYLLLALLLLYCRFHINSMNFFPRSFVAYTHTHSALSLSPSPHPLSISTLALICDRACYFCSVRFQYDSITYFILFLYHRTIWHHVLRFVQKTNEWSNIDVRGVANKTIVLRPIKCYFIYIFSICHRSSYSFYG